MKGLPMFLEKKIKITQILETVRIIGGFTQDDVFTVTSSTHYFPLQTDICTVEVVSFKKKRRYGEFLVAIDWETGNVRVNVHVAYPIGYTPLLGFLYAEFAYLTKIKFVSVSGLS